MKDAQTHNYHTNVKLFCYKQNSNLYACIFRMLYIAACSIHNFVSVTYMKSFFLNNVLGFNQCWITSLISVFLYILITCLHSSICFPTDLFSEKGRDIVFVNMYSQIINEIVPSSFPTPLHLPRYHGHSAMPLTTGQRSHDHTTILSHSFPWTIAWSLPL